MLNQPNLGLFLKVLSVCTGAGSGPSCPAELELEL